MPNCFASIHTSKSHDPFAKDYVVTKLYTVY